MQTSPKKDLPKRTRYYQAMIDLNHLEKGADYNDLKKALIIFVCLFDPFEKDQYVYTFENVCAEIPGLILGDDTKKIFISTKGKGNINRKLKALLNYIDGENPSDEFTKILDDAVTRAKSNEKWRRDYMTYYLKLREEYSEGRAEGRAEGKELNILESITSLMKTLRLSAEQAMDALQIPEKDWPKYKNKLKL